MDKQKQIEEMAHNLCHIEKDCQDCKLNGICLAYNYAEIIFNTGYRKIPENAVVQHYEAEIEALEFELSQSNKVIKTIRKETAEKFAIKAKESFFGVNCIDIGEWNWYHDKLDEICKEISEGK